MACQPGGDGGSDYNLTARDIWSLELNLAAETTNAGEPLGLEVRMVSEDGEIAEIAHWTLSSDVEERVQYTRQDVTPTLGGDHVLIVEGTSGEREYSAEASLFVGPGSPYMVDLNLSDHGLLAGDQVEWSVSASDQWGNLIDTTGVEPEVDNPDLTVTASSLTSTVPGTYRAPECCAPF